MAELYEGHEIKAGDSLTLSWDLGIDIAAEGFTGATVLIASLGKEPIVYRSGVINGSTVSIVLTNEETAVPGEYRAEVKLFPGPITHPSDGWTRVRIFPAPSGTGNTVPVEWVAPGAFATAAQVIRREQVAVREVNHG